MTITIWKNCLGKEVMAHNFTLLYVSFILGGIYYNIHAVTLSGNNGEIFRGFFVQARLVADDTSQTGTFVVVDPDNSKLSACTPSSVGFGFSQYLCFVCSYGIQLLRLFMQYLYMLFIYVLCVCSVLMFYVCSQYLWA